MSTPDEIQLHTGRLLLRRLRAADAPAIQRLAGDSRVSRFTAHIPHPYPDGAAEAFIAESRGKQSRGEANAFAIAFSKEPDTLIGMIGLIDRGSDGVEIGYWLGVPYWGKGVMSEAVASVAAHARAWRPGSTVFAHTFPENPASQRVLEKAGFKRRGIGVCDAPARGRYIEDAPLFVFDTAEAAHAETAR